MRSAALRVVQLSPAQCVAATYAGPVARGSGGRHHEAVLARRVHDAAAGAGRVLWQLGDIRPNSDTEQLAAGFGRARYQ